VALLKIENQIFYPFLRKTLPSDLRPLLQDLERQGEEVGGRVLSWLSFLADLSSHHWRLRLLFLVPTEPFACRGLRPGPGARLGGRALASPVILLQVWFAAPPHSLDCPFLLPVLLYFLSSPVTNLQVTTLGQRLGQVVGKFRDPSSPPSAPPSPPSSSSLPSSSRLARLDEALSLAGKMEVKVKDMIDTQDRMLVPVVAAYLSQKEQKKFNNKGKSGSPRNTIVGSWRKGDMHVMR